MAEKNKSIGALWVKEKGEMKYLSGNIEINGVKHELVVFKNSYKQQENHPDYKIYLMQKP